MAPSWAGPTGAVLSATGARVTFLGLKSGNPYVIGAGLGLGAIGVGLTTWGWLTDPSDAFENAEKNFNELQ